MNTASFSNIFSIIIAGAFLVISLSLVVFAVMNALRENKQIERRLSGASGAGVSDFNRPKNSGKFLAKLGAHLTLPDAAEISRLRFQLSQAGYYDVGTVKTFIAARVLCVFGPQFLVMAAWPLLYEKVGLNGAVLTAVILAGIGFVGPLYFIKFKRQQRTNQCRRGFPDMMDLLVACIEAGLGLDAALVRVSHEIGGRYPPLKINLEIMNLELRNGRLRHDAMNAFAERIDLEEAKALAVMLRQAEEMGSSMGTALRTFSEEMRAKRMLKAEEKAMALSAKLTVPLLIFIFPTIMVLLLVPAGLRMSEAFI